MLPACILQVLKANDACVRYVYVMAIITVPMIAIMTIRDLKWLTPTSLLANVLLISGFIMVWYYVFQDLPPIWQVDAFAEWYVHKLMFCVSLYIEIFNIK